MKIYSTRKGASMSRTELNPYGVGLMRLQEMSIAAENFSDEDITHIGFCSIHRIKVVLCKVGNFWGIRGRMGIQLNQFETTHGYRGHIRSFWIVSGKKIQSLRPHYNATAEQLMASYNGQDTYSRPVSEMTAMEIFMITKGRRPSRRHAPKMTSSERIASATRMEKL